MTTPGVVSYATSEDLAGWLPPGVAAPADPTGLLRSASIAVGWACDRNVYTDTPSSTDAVPLRDATCAQAASWLALGVSPADRGAGEASVKRTKVLTAEVEYDTASSSAQRTAAAADLAPEARTILLSAGLLWQPVPTSDPNAGVLSSWGTGIPIYGYGYDLTRYPPLSESVWPPY